MMKRSPIEVPSDAVEFNRDLRLRIGKVHLSDECPGAIQYPVLVHGFGQTCIDKESANETAPPA